MVISEHIYTMLITPAKFQEFTPRKICDARLQTEALLCLSCESREEVTELTNKALAAGAERVNPTKDYGFMLLESFSDLDGHIWELFYMDPSHVQPQAGT
jgi:predicted lactoylglutathione lyase